MNLNKKVLIILMCIAYSLTNTISIAAQNIEQIKLLDEDNSLPIQGATYAYGNQKGLSDDDGLIAFVLTPGAVMHLSHFNYGTWEFGEQELKEVIRQKVHYQKSIIFNLYPVTVIAVRSSQNPYEKIKMDDQDRLEHDGAAILSQSPAISSIQKGGNYGFDPVFRGFKYDQLNIVLNGAQSATAACPNRMDPPTSQMAPNMMDRVEILKGPHALRFGTGFGATINFIPTPLRFTSEQDVYGRFSSSYQSNGSVLRSEGQVGLSGSVYNLNLFGSWSQGNDYKAGNGQTVQADFERASFGTNLGVKLSSNQKLSLSAIYNLARDADFPALPMDLRADDTWMFNARHDIMIDNERLKSWNTTLFGSFVDHVMNNLLKPLDPRMLNAETVANTYNYGGRTEGTWRFANGKLFAGADVRVEEAQGTRVREFVMGPNAGKSFRDNAWQNGHVSKASVFWEYQLKKEMFQYVFSGRLEMNNSDINDPSPEFTEIFSDPQATQINSSLSLGVLKKLGTSIQTGLWLGRAQRSGSLTERFINYFPVGQDPYEMLGNPQLDPEVNNQLDLHIGWTTEQTALNIDLFASYLQDYISSLIDEELNPRLPMSSGVRRFVNIDEAFKTGFEVNWTQLLPIGLQHQMGIAYTYGQDLEREEPLPEIAPLDFRYTLSGSYLDEKLQPEVRFRRVLEQSRISGEFGETTTTGFSLLDVKCTYRPFEKISFKAAVNNLLNENYYEHLTRAVRGTNKPIFAPGRNFIGSISISF